MREVSGGGPIDSRRRGDGERRRRLWAAARQPRRVIKRYSNRKLYDTKDSRYVTLQQIGEMVRAGEEVQIIDNATKEDKTEVTLALIISEDLKSQPRSRPARHAAGSDPGARRAPARRSCARARSAGSSPARSPARAAWRRLRRRRAPRPSRRRRCRHRPMPPPPLDTDRSSHAEGAPERDRRELEADARPVAAGRRRAHPRDPAGRRACSRSPGRGQAPVAAR